MGLRAVSTLPLLLRAMPDAQLVGFVDPQPVAEITARLGQDLPPRYDTVAQMLAEANADLLWVASPNHFHLADIRTGLEAGLRVFTEKPVVTSLGDTIELARLLDKHGADRVMVGLVLRYSQHMRDLRAAQLAGWLGDITSLEANELIEPAHGAFFMRDWRRDTEMSGGFMLEKCCHDLDIYNMVTGSRPVQVASFGGRKAFVPENAPDAPVAIYTEKPAIWDGVPDAFGSDGDIIDYQTALLHYASGATLSFHTNLNAPAEQRRFCVVGTKGMAEGDFVRGQLTITDAATQQQHAHHDYRGGTEMTGAHYGADDMMCRDLALYLQGESDSLPVSIVDALEAGVAALALDVARTSGQTYDLRPFWAEFDQFNLRRNGSDTNGSDTHGSDTDGFNTQGAGPQGVQK
jgi:predicted dehydrogenase